MSGYDSSYDPAGEARLVWADDLVPFSALRASGFLWAVNHHWLHPQGLQLGLHMPAGTTVGREPLTTEPLGWTLDASAEPFTYPPESDRVGAERWAATQAIVRGRLP